MIATDRLIYLELQKTGCSHVRRLLKEHFNGSVTGKHNRPRNTDVTSRFVVGSIRNPWEWYVSLWAFGASGRGAVRHRTGRKVELGYYHRQLPKAMGKNWLSISEFVTSFLHDSVKPVAKWRSTYENSEDPDQFRMWLKLILNPVRRFDIGEGFGFSPLSQYSGFLTYRFFRLFTVGSGVFKDTRLNTSAGLELFDKEQNVANAIIRTENLEEDFIRAVRLAGYAPDKSVLGRIRNSARNKTNVSDRREVEHYYDEETVRLVALRDEYIIEKFGYKPPDLSRPFLKV